MVGRLRNSLNSTPSDAAVADQFGRSVSLHGDTALIGAYADDDNSKSNSGSVYVFKAPPRSNIDDPHISTQQRLNSKLYAKAMRQLLRIFSVDPFLCTGTRR